jgi:hypothetical protein
MSGKVTTHGPPFINALVDAGVIPPNCKRIVIDCNTGAMITIHYELFADQRINDPSVLDAVFEMGLKIKESAG